ncbi:MAG: flagellar hook-length control protein FliK, partial [Sedimenticolaceae bacterium]
PSDAADNKTQQLQLLQLLIRLSSGGKTQQREIAEPVVNNEQAGNAKTALGDSLINRLMRLVEGSLARIQLQQAASLPNEDGQRQAWQLDLPIQLPDQTHQAKLRIEREAAGGDQGAAAGWAVNLAFKFDSIGGLQCRIALAGERVSTTFWSDRRSTHERVEQRLPVLREAFEAQGLEVVHLVGVLGEPTEPLITVPVPDSLLDEHA